ncbi:MAG: hypothetical protein ACLVJH_05025 [Faecalibacterium prausnitzii]
MPQAEEIYRSILNARTALKGFARRRTLTLRLPPVLLQRDPIYPMLMARLHAALPGYELRVDTRPAVGRNAHLMLWQRGGRSRRSALWAVAAGGRAYPHPAQHLLPDRIAGAPALQGASSSGSWPILPGSSCFMSRCIRKWWIYAVVQPGLPFPHQRWRMVGKTTPSVYTELLAGRGMFCVPDAILGLPGSVVPAGMAAPAGHRSADLAGRSPPGDCQPAPGVHRGLRREDKSIDPIKNGTSAAVPFYLSQFSGHKTAAPGAPGAAVFEGGNEVNE